MSDIEISDDTRIERYIWKQIGKKTAREMAADLGVSPDDILRVKMTMVDSVDELTIQVQRAKLLQTLQTLSDDAQERAENTDDRNYAGMINASTSAIKALLVELNRVSKADDARVTELNALRVRELLALMTDVVDGGVREAAETYELDEEELFDIFNRHLMEAARKRDSE